MNSPEGVEPSISHNVPLRRDGRGRGQLAGGPLAHYRRSDGSDLSLPQRPNLNLNDGQDQMTPVGATPQVNILGRRDRARQQSLMQVLA